MMRFRWIANSLIILLLVGGLTLIIINTFDSWGYSGQLVNQYLTDLQTLEIRGEMTIGQTFIAPANNLQRIDVMLRTYNRTNTADVTFYLKPAPESPEILYQETFNATDVGHNRWRTFEFPPIPDSADRSFFFYLASPESTTGNAITVGGAVGDYYAKGEAYFGPIPTSEGDLAFRTYYGLSTSEKLMMMGQRLTESKPSLWGNIRFYGLLTVLYFLIAVRVGVELVKVSD